MVGDYAVDTARSRLQRWLRRQPGYPSGVAAAAGVRTEAARRWLRDGIWPSAESLLRLRATRGLDLNALIDNGREGKR